MDNKLFAPVKKRGSSALSDSSGEKVMPRHGNKSAKWMVYLLFRLCKEGELIQDTCAITLATARACLKLPEYRCFVDREKSFTCFLDTLPSLSKR